jgi:DNA-binding GntR family transcriptional regulator
MLARRGSVLVEGSPGRSSASRVASEIIQEAIVDGRLAPGQRLKEEKIAWELGMSRTPVREALLLQQSEGPSSRFPGAARR